MSHASDHHTDIGTFILLALAFLHLAAIVRYRLKRGQNLVIAMVWRNKQTEPAVPGARDDLATRVLAPGVLALSVGAAAALLIWPA